MADYVRDPECRLIIENKEYLFTKAVWSGNKSEAARRLTFGLAKSDVDPYLPDFPIDIENLVQFYAYGEEVFRGYVTDISDSMNSNETEVICYDASFYLLHSQATRTYRGTTPDQTTTDICNEMGVPVAKTMPGEPYDRIHDEDSAYDIIMTGYTIQSNRDDKQYMVWMDKGALNIVSKGEKVCPDLISTQEVITDASFGRSIMNSVNRVKIYDEERNLLDTIKDESGEIDGVLQAIVQADGSNALEDAKALLKGIEKTAAISGRGRIECITGNACVVEEGYTGLKGLYFIDGDSHEFDNSKHTMSLELAFENIMDRIVSGSDESESASGSGYHGIPVTGPASEMYNIMRELGYSQAAASAMIGNAYYESKLDPTITQQGGPGMGLFQWSRGERWDQLLAWTKANGYDPYSLEGQIRFADHEMKTQGWLMDGVGGHEAFRTSNSIVEAHRMFYNGFERPAYNPANYTQRLEKSKEYLASFSELERQNMPSGGAISDGNWVHPLPGYPITSRYNEHRSWDRYNGGYHMGTDIAAPQGTPMVAASAGTVKHAGWMDGYGNLVIIDHGGGVETYYAHIMPNGFNVRAGQSVSTGQVIARVGTTGPSTGPHLHFEVRRGGKPVSPAGVI